MTDALERFSPATREWFAGAFPAPTLAQVGAWQAISSGQHALVVDTDPDTGKVAVRGIFSLSQIGQQLGLEIQPQVRPTTFAEIENALMRG